MFMGFRWRLLAPKSQARPAGPSAVLPTRPCRQVGVAPKPVQQARRAAWRAASPGDALERAIENQIIREARKRRKR